MLRTEEQRNREIVREMGADQGKRDTDRQRQSYREDRERDRQT